jgi:microcystin-dependent protein
MSDPFIGEIRAWALNYAPRGWAMCNGQSIPIQQQQALFAVLGLTYGGSMTSNQFNLPDLRGAVPMAAGTPSSKWGLPDVPFGKKLGSTAVTLTSGNLPNHTHQAVAAVAPSAMTSTPAATTYVSRPTIGTTATYNAWVGPTTAVPLPTPNTVMAPTMIGPTGGGQAHENRQPFLTLNFCIAETGVYPSRQ